MSVQVPFEVFKVFRAVRLVLEEVGLRVWLDVRVSKVVVVAFAGFLDESDLVIGINATITRHIRRSALKSVESLRSVVA